MSKTNGVTISRGGSGLPSRTVFHGVEGIGKSSLGANFSAPIFSMTRGETGLLTLIDNGLVNPTDHFPEAHSWRELLHNVEHLIGADHPYKSYVLDTLNGAERLCLEYVVDAKFDGDTKAYLAYGKGIQELLNEWVKFIALLDELRSAKRMSVLCLCHTRIKKYGNPEGEDYDRFTPDMEEKVWGLTHKWADVVLFGNFLTTAKKERGSLKGKATGGDGRMIYTTRTAAFDAKNRVGLPPSIPMGRTGKEAWEALKTAMVAARKRAAAIQQAESENKSIDTVENIDNNGSAKAEAEGAVTA